MLLNCEFLCFPDCADWIILALGFLLSVAWAFFIYSLNPKLKIGIPQKINENNREIISIPIENLSKKSKISNLSIEVAVIDGDYTYHFEFDKSNFAFIPPKKCTGTEHLRNFKAYQINEYLQSVWQLSFEEVIGYLNNENSLLRVRIHATYSFSGLGKTFEKKFTFNNGCFCPIDN